MTRSASRGTSSKARTIRASRRPAVLRSGTAAHMPSSSWRRNSCTSSSSSSATSTSPSAMSTSPCPGFMRRNLMVNGDYDKARVPAHPPRPTVCDGRWPRAAARRRPRALSGGARQPEDVDGPGAGPDRAQAVADGLRGDALGLARGGLEVVAERQPRGQRRGVRAARAVRGAVGVARPGELDHALAVEDDVDRLLAVPAGDHDGARARARGRRAASSSPSRRVVAGEHPRLGEVGGDDRGAGDDELDERGLGVLVEQPRAGLGDHHRVDHDRRAGRQQVEGLPHRPRAGHASEHPDLDRVDADVLDDGAHLRDDHRRRHGLDRRHRHRVLRRDGRDRGRAVHAGAREGLQVGLDPGAAAGVRAGDRQADGYAAGVGHGGEG